MKKCRIMLSVAAIITTLNLTIGSALGAQAASRQEADVLPDAPSSSAAVSAVSAASSNAVTGDFLLLDVNGRVCVYEGDTLLMTTAIDVMSLPASDRAALAQGIHAKDSAELAAYLEDFGA